MFVLPTYDLSIATFPVEFHIAFMLCRFFNVCFYSRLLSCHLENSFQFAYPLADFNSTPHILFFSSKLLLYSVLTLHPIPIRPSPFNSYLHTSFPSFLTRIALSPRWKLNFFSLHLEMSWAVVKLGHQLMGARIGAVGRGY